ncbi:MAG: Coenzyme F420 hydrogenase/dehydrogenase, beta subunit C-terminal domain [Desulfobacterales bacterium]|nr:Coenzyme F420 hydrogenase/dehydrogenase, beta subunit C-terminal domain [Desulfobacterales bacterium]
MQVFGPSELLEDVLNAGLCIGCGACVNLCPYFRSYKGKTAMLFPCSRETGRCHAFCPKTEVDLDALSTAVCGSPYSGSPTGTYQQVFMARAGEGAGNGDFQDGGTVSALMKFALESNMIDGAVLTGRNGLVPAPGLTTSAREVPAFASSKYTAAPTLAALNDGFNRGFRQMGVVGTPCQLTAVAQMRTNPLQDANFADPVALTIGLFCTWALDTRGLLAFAQKRAPGEQIRKMHVPPPPAGIIVLETDTRTLEIPLEEIRPLVPAGCRICPDMTAEWADLSVGAMEGKAGWNTLIVRTAKGNSLVRKAAVARYLELADFPRENWKDLETAAADKKRRAFEKARQDGTVNAEAGCRAALRVDPRTLEKMTAD